MAWLDVGIFAWFGFPIPMAERAEMIRDAGYKSVMLWWGDDHSDIDGPKEKQPELFRSKGLRVVNVHAPFEEANQLWADTLRGQAVEETLSGCLADCRDFGIPTAVVHLTGGWNPPEANQVGLERIRSLAEQAERLGVDIALENLRHPHYLDFIYDRVSSSRLKFCYDSGHENCRTPHMDLLERFGDKLVALHLHDNDGTGDQHILPFAGTVPWDRVAAHIRHLGYAGDLTLEIDTYQGANPAYTADEFLRQGMARMLRLREMIGGNADG